MAAAGEAVSMPRQIGALVAGWLLPGAGHAVLGRYRRAALFAAIVLGSFGLGLAHDARLALIDPNDATRWGPRRLPGVYLSLTQLQVIASLGTGPLDAVARIAVYGEPAYVLSTVSDDRREKLLNVFRSRMRSETSPYGTAYLWTAGLMNLLLLLDVWDIGRGRKP